MAHKRSNLKCYRLSRSRDLGSLWVVHRSRKSGSSSSSLGSTANGLVSFARRALHDPGPRGETCTRVLPRAINLAILLSTRRIRSTTILRFSLLLIVVTNLVENARFCGRSSWVLFLTSLLHFPFETHDCYVNCIIGINACCYTELHRNGIVGLLRVYN